MSTSPTRGFSLLELSIALVVIAIILSMVGSGRDLMFSAKAMATHWSQVQAWRTAFQEFRRRTNAYPADKLTQPTGLIHAALDSPLCNAPGQPELSNTLLAAGVALPERTARQDRPDIMLYTDDQGISHTSDICMISVAKSVPGQSVGSTVQVAKPALLIKGLHHSLAQHLDATLDGTLSTRFGQVRTRPLAGQAAYPTPGGDCWGDPQTGCQGPMASGAYTDLIVFLE